MAQCVYRLRLCESLHREIVARSSRYSRTFSDSPGGEVEDMLHLKNALPSLESGENADCVTTEIEAALKGCTTALVRSIPPGNIAHYMRLAHQQSLRPYLPSADELPMKVG